MFPELKLGSMKGSNDREDVGDGADPTKKCYNSVVSLIWNVTTCVRQGSNVSFLQHFIFQLELLLCLQARACEGGNIMS